MQYLTDPFNEMEDYKHAYNCGHKFLLDHTEWMLSVMS